MSHVGVVPCRVVQPLNCTLSQQQQHQLECSLCTDAPAALQVDDGTQTEITALYDMTTNTFVPYHITEHPFCSGHTLLPDGRGIIVGMSLSEPPLMMEGGPQP